MNDIIFYLSFILCVCRLVQYSARLLAWLLEDDGSSLMTVQRARSLESSISLARKCMHQLASTHCYMTVVSVFGLLRGSINISQHSLLSYLVFAVFRLGKSMDLLRASLHTLHLVNPIHRLLITLSKINRGLYLLFDHIVWAAKLKLITADAARWNKTASRFWTIAVVFGLLRDIYDLLIVFKAELAQSATTQGRRNRGRSLSSAVSRTLVNHPALALDLLKNSTDIFIPLSNLQVVNMSSGAVGLMGVVSSLCGLIALWNDSLKLQHS